MVGDEEFERVHAKLAAHEPELVAALRAELAERSPSEAGACPSWGRYAGWLRAHGHADVGEWLTLALAGQRRAGDRQRLLDAARRVLAKLGEPAGTVWRGELGWSLWFGPFMLGYIGEPPPDPVGLQAALGPLATFLSRERVWIDGDPERWLLAELEPGVPLLVTQTLPGAQEPLAAFLLRELREHYGPLALSTAEVSWHLEDMGMISMEFPPDPIPEEARAVISCSSLLTTTWLHRDSVDALAGVAVVGAPELLEFWPAAGRHESAFGPRPSFERRYAELAADHPALIDRLRSELAATPLTRAHTCPSWPVFLDWLLERGWEAFASWLRLDLSLAHAGARTRKPNAELESLALRLIETELAAVRPSEAATLREIWSARESDVARSIWLGPFMLAHFDPGLRLGRGADELQAWLGPHALFLPRERVYTAIDRDWVEQAMTVRDGPTLAPVPHASVVFGGLIRHLHHEHDFRGPAEQIRVARPGELVGSYPNGAFATNVGPIAANNQATAVICCESATDLKRHHDRWSELQDYERLILIGTPELLAGWTRAATWIDAYRATPGR